MRISRLSRMPVCRSLIGFFRGDVSCIMVTCMLIMGILLVALATSPSTTPTVLTSIQHTEFDMQIIQRDSINTILIEDSDGGVYVAFQIPKSSDVVKAIKNGKFKIHTTKESKDLNVLNKDERSNKNIIKTKAPVNMPYTETNISRIFSKSTSEYTKVITYPITVLNDPYSLNNEKICRQAGSLSFVVLVHSSTTHFMRRSAIRETWANYKLLRKRNMRIVFLLGQPEKKTTQALIEHEHFINGDIVQGHFIDSYHNLTHKGVLGIRWVSEFCPRVKLVVKVDDDVFLNVFKLLDDIEKGIYSNKSKEIWCPVRQKGTSLIQRDKGKWKIDDSEFKNMTYFPVTYCNGFFAILTRDLIADMFSAAKHTPFFWVDDVYLFGLLPDKVGKVKHTQLVNLNLNETKAIECFNSRIKKCDLLVATTAREGVMDKLWFRALDQYKDLAAKYSEDKLFE